MEVIQEAKCERGAWLFQGCRKPSTANKLDTRWFLFSRLPAVAVFDANDRDTGNVEDGEVKGDGRPCTTFADTVAELVRGTELTHCGSGEELARPFLEGTLLELKINENRYNGPTSTLCSGPNWWAMTMHCWQRRWFEKQSRQR